ncbi:hypothetical protein T03_15816 [Trichinella britovi]|uniref:Uncharacterized protein n=1 Tax=Trichinella britovi TaxID=45882 RepID=A0A0V1CC16_TRIBR|nr:hypothetical protein T03_15816 [Trichinella britovi]
MHYLKSQLGIKECKRVITQSTGNNMRHIESKPQTLRNIHHSFLVCSQAIQKPIVRLILKN